MRLVPAPLRAAASGASRRRQPANGGLQAPPESRPAAGVAVSQRANLLGHAVDRLTLEQTVQRIEGLIAGGRPARQVALDPTAMAALRSDRRLQEIFAVADIVNAEGQGVVWASRLLGDPLPERVAVPDLLEALLAVSSSRGYRIFILGARQEVLERAVGVLRQRYPGLRIVGYRNGYFAPHEEQMLCAEIRKSRPDILLVAITSPKKDYWIDAHMRDLGVPFSMGVGGAVDVIAGVRTRAPRWVQRAGLEWAFRMLQEPRRLAKRFLVANAFFVALLARELARQRLVTPVRDRFAGR